MNCWWEIWRRKGRWFTVILDVTERSSAGCFLQNFVIISQTTWRHILQYRNLNSCNGNCILQSTCRSPKWSCPLRGSQQNSLRTSLVHPNVLYAWANNFFITEITLQYSLANMDRKAHHYVIFSSFLLLISSGSKFFLQFFLSSVWEIFTLYILPA